MEKQQLLTQFNAIINNTDDLEVLNTFYNTIKDRIDVVSSSGDSSVSSPESKKVQSVHIPPKRTVLNDVSQIEDYVERVSTPVFDDDIHKGLAEELKKLGPTKTSNGQVYYKWISCSDLPYEFGGRSYKPLKMSLHPALSAIMVKLSDVCGYSLDSCLLSFYEDSKTASPRHADNEKSLDPNAPICSISFGPDRIIDFYDIKTGHKLSSVAMNDRTTLIMKRGCQSNLKHQVQPAAEEGTRFCLSFRKSAPGVLKVFDTSGSSVSPSPQKLDKIQHIILGDSLTCGVELPNTLTLTKSGGRPEDMLSLIISKVDPRCYPNITSIILLVGTNSVSLENKPCAKPDVRNFSPIVNVMNQYQELINNLSSIFPRAYIGLFNIPPRRWMNTLTPYRIGIFNHFLHECAEIYANVVTIRMFDAFLLDGKLNRKYYQSDGLHFNSNGIEYLTECFSSFHTEVVSWLADP